MMGNTIPFLFRLAAARAESVARSASGGGPIEPMPPGIERAEHNRAVAHQLEALLGLLDADGLADQRRRYVDEPAAPLDLAICPYTLHSRPARIFGRAQATAPAALGRHVKAGRNHQAERFVRTLLVVNPQELSKAPRLGRQRGRGRARGLLLQRQVQPLQTPVLLRARRVDPLRQHTRL